MVTVWPAFFSAAAACSWVACLRSTPFTCRETEDERGRKSGRERGREKGMKFKQFSSDEEIGMLLNLA